MEVLVMLTELGKFLRHYRIEHGILLKDMAACLNIPSSFLSSIETGRKPIPSGLVDKIIQAYRLDHDQIKEIKKAEKLSISTVKIDLHDSNIEKKEMVFSFARQFDSMDSEQIKKLLSFLNKGDSDD